MDIIECAEAVIRQFPGLSYKIDGKTLTVDPADDRGFSVSLEIDEPAAEFLVGFDGWVWHTEVEEEEVALCCFLWGLTDQCRLKITARGGKDYRYKVEFNENGEWRSAGGMILYFGPAIKNLWRKKSVAYRRNSIIKGDLATALSPASGQESNIAAISELLESAGIEYPPPPPPPPKLTHAQKVKALKKRISGGDPHRLFFGPSWYPGRWEDAFKWRASYNALLKNRRWWPLFWDIARHVAWNWLSYIVLFLIAAGCLYATFLYAAWYVFLLAVPLVLIPSLLVFRHLYWSRRDRRFSLAQRITFASFQDEELKNLLSEKKEFTYHPGDPSRGK
jgi:hypothetical protein